MVVYYFYVEAKKSVWKYEQKKTKPTTIAEELFEYLEINAKISKNLTLKIKHQALERRWISNYQILYIEIIRDIRDHYIEKLIVKD